MDPASAYARCHQSTYMPVTSASITSANSSNCKIFLAGSGRRRERSPVMVTTQDQKKFHSQGLKFLSILGLGVGLGLAAHAADLLAPVAAPAEPAGMKVLFSGKDLSGWDGDKRLWSVKDGAIHGETTPEAAAQGNTFLILKDQSYGNFDLRLSFRCNATNNSGIQYRSKHITEGSLANAWVVRGYQHEIRNQNKLPNVSGFIYDEGGKRARLCFVGEKATWENSSKNVVGTLLDAAGFEKLFKLDDWNDVIIIARGNHIQHYLNGTLILDFTDNDPQLALKEGIIALQLHAGKPMWAEYKNIRIKDLGKE
jgi:hypothetical protein